jgi:magnesium transporter
MLELYYEANGVMETATELDKIKERIALNNRNMLLKVVTTSEEEFDFLTKVLNLHIMTLKSIRSSKHIPKIEVFDNYVSTIMYDINLGYELNSYDISPVGILLKENLTIILCKSNLQVFEEMLKRINASPVNNFKETCNIYYIVLDVLVDNHFTILASLGSKLEMLQENLLGKDKQDYSDKIMTIRRNILELRKDFAYEQEVLYRISHEKLAFICNDIIAYMRDVFHHLEKLNAMLLEYNDWASNLTDAYAAFSSSKLNDRLQMLTIIQYIFMPLGFLTGWYGMGFRMPEEGFRYSYPIFVVATAIITVSVVIYFKRKKML